ncbi:MAG: efflux RND transporter permease subunit [Lentisphaerae bacterium]|nr:efflux RND transporter permease subunit [Lentisphaerota bacterium]
MFVSDICIKRPVLASVVMIITAILGMSSYSRLGVELFPDIEFPMTVVTTAYPGAGPDEIETLVTKPIEDNLTLVDNVKYIQSYSSEGLSTVMVRFEMGTDLDVAASDVRDQVNQVQAVLPDDAESPVVTKLDPQAFPVMRLAASGDLPLMDLYQAADDIIRTELGRIQGVGLIRIVGGEHREIRVEVDQARLEASGVSIGQVIAAIAGANVEIPGGRISRGGREYAVRVFGKIDDLDLIAETPLPGAPSVRVGDVAEVRDTVAEVRTMTRHNGRGSVGVEVLKKGDANTVLVGREVRAAIARLNDGPLPASVAVDVVTDDSVFIRDVIREVRDNMIQGIVLTALALYLFLHSGRGTFVIGLAMPTSVIATFVALYAAGYSVNIMSMMGLAISIGILVNNAILVLENIHRHIDLGDDPKTAASRGTSEIALAVSSTTLTNLVVFLPIAFMESIVGQVFRQFAMTIVFSTFFSLFVSFTLTPMAASLLLRGRTEEERLLKARTRRIYAAWDGIYDSMARWYEKAVRRCLAHPWLTLALTAAAVALVMLTVPRLIGGEFFPETDQGQFAVDIETDVSSSLEYTDGVARRVEEILAAIPELDQVYATVGSQAGGHLAGSAEAPNRAQVVVKLVDVQKRRRSTARIMAALRPELAAVVGARLAVKATQEGGPGGTPIELEVRGEDFDVLNSIAADVLTVSRGGTLGGVEYAPVPGLVDADTDWRAGKPEIGLRPERTRMRQRQVSIESLAAAIRSYYTGTVATRYREGDDEYDVRVQLRDEDRRRFAALSDLTVQAGDGRLVRVSEVAEEVRSTGPTHLARKDRQHMVKVSGNTSGRTSGEVHKDMVARIAAVRLPEGYTFRWAGDIEFMQENFRDLYNAMLLATVLTYLLLAGMLESWKLSLLVMLSLPISFAGVFIGLLIRGSTINIFSLMGMVMLIGLVINNSIVIIDYIGVVRQTERLPLLEAIPKACAVRLRPLLMAEATTVIALVPLAMGSGAGGEYRAPMAVTEMGGMLAGAMLSLIVAPVLYYLAFRRAERKAASGA